MLGRDVNSYPTQYRVWVVNNQPDFTGEFYTGLKSGDDDFVNISALEIKNDNAIVDFSLQDQRNWHIINKTLPVAVQDSQLAIISDFAYLFGGLNSDIILRAELNNPATWEDSGGRLPTSLGGSQLAIVDGYIYLFGGIIDSDVSDSIYTAPIDNPLSWTDSGFTLPSPLRNSQLGIADGYIYLFGGATTSGATNTIFRASVDDPLVWVDTGDTLPDPIFGSHIGVIDNYFYLFGGTTDGYSPIDSIYKSSVLDPTNFSVAGSFPLGVWYGQFFTIGRDGYLIAPAAYADESGDTFPYVTKLFKCSLSDPTVWQDFSTIDGSSSQSQIAVIYDRLFLFGGNGSSLIFTTNLTLKYPIGDGSLSQIYGDITRTQYQSVSDPLDLIRVIGFPYWKTNYTQ